MWKNYSDFSLKYSTWLLFSTSKGIAYGWYDSTNNKITKYQLLGDQLNSIGEIKHWIEIPAPPEGDFTDKPGFQTIIK